MCNSRGAALRFQIKKKQDASHLKKDFIWSELCNLLPMMYVFPGDLWLTQFIQNMGDWLTPLMKFFTWLGYPQAYMIIIAVIYWSFDRKLGLRLAVFLTVVASLNSLLKQALHAPRPYWYKPDITAILPSNGFGMPSGHAQGSIVWLYAAFCLKKNRYWFLAAGVAFLVGLSRVYLGVHFPSQVLMGWMTGILLFLFFSLYERKVLAWFMARRFTHQVIWLSGFTLLMLVTGVAILALSREWEMPLDWIIHAADDLAGRDESILHSVGLDAVAGNAGGFLGTTLGALLIHRLGGFDPGGRTRTVRGL